MPRAGLEPARELPPKGFFASATVASTDACGTCEHETGRPRPARCPFATLGASPVSTFFLQRSRHAEEHLSARRYDPALWAEVLGPRRDHLQRDVALLAPRVAQLLPRDPR